MKTLAVLQPGYLPWLGFFEQLYRSDIFVYYDDVQFDKHGWRNRNRIKAPSGPHWLTVPVLHKGLDKPLIMDIEINSEIPWARKHLGTIQQFYSKAPYQHLYMTELTEILSRPWKLLVDLDIVLVDCMARWLGIEKQIVRSSTLDLKGERSQRLLEICKYFSADCYLTGDAARSYLDVDIFSSHKIEVQWQDYQHPVYPQLFGEFVSHLSTLDLLMNMGYESLNTILKKSTQSNMNQRSLIQGNV